MEEEKTRNLGKSMKLVTYMLWSPMYIDDVLVIVAVCLSRTSSYQPTTETSTVFCGLESSVVSGNE